MTHAVVPSVVKFWHAHAGKSQIRLHRAQSRPDFAHLETLVPDRLVLDGCQIHPQARYEMTPVFCRLMSRRAHHLAQRRQALLNQHMGEQYAYIEQARSLVALLVTGVAHKVSEACCCTVAGTSMVPDKGGT